MAAAEALDEYYFEKFENVSASYGNTAPEYDDDYYEVAEPVIKPYKVPGGRRRGTGIGSNNGRIALAVAVIIMTCAVICADLSGWAKGYELSREIARVEESIVAAEGEKVRLNNELDSKTNIAKVEDYAENVLGMILVENYQVEYIDLSQGDKIINSAEE